MADEQERLELVSSVEDEFTPELETLEQRLEDIDDQIRDTGRGRDHVEINVEVTGDERALGDLTAVQQASEIVDDETVTVDVDAEREFGDAISIDGEHVDVDVFTADAIAEVAALDAALSELPDEKEIDIETDTETVPSGDRRAVTSGGRPPVGDPDELIDPDRTLRQDDLLRRFAGSQPFPAVNLGDEGRRTIGTTRAFGPERNFGLDRDVSVNVGMVDPRLLDEAEFSDADVAFTDAFMEGDRAVDTETSARLMADLFDKEDPRFAGEVEFEDVLSTQRQPGLAAEGIPAEASIDLAQSVKRATEIQDEERDDGPGLLRRTTDAMSELRFTASAYHTLLASLIPIFATFAASLPVAIAGVTALGVAAITAAGALAGIGLIGALGISLRETGELSLDPITERLSDISDAFVDAFSPLARSLAPFVETLLTEIEAMMGPLATASSGLLDFRQQFSAATAFITKAVPKVVSSLLGFAEATTPILAGLVTFVSDANILQSLATILADALPLLIRLGNFLVNLIPLIIQLSQGFLVVAAATASVIGPFVNFLTSVKGLVPFIGVLIGMFINLVAISTVYSVVTSGATAAALKFAAVIGIQAVQALTAYIGTTATAVVVTGTLIGLLTFGLAPLLSSLGGLFGSFGSNVASARQELEQFADAQNGIGDTGFGGSASAQTSSSSVYRDDSTTIIQSTNRDGAARQQYSSQYERRQQIDSVFGA